MTYPSTLTEAMSALTAAGWKPTLDRQTGADAPDFPDDLDISYVSVTLDGSPYPHKPDTGRVVEIFVSTCDCSEADDHIPDDTPGSPARGFMVVFVEDADVDEVAEDHVDAAELDAYCRFWLRDEVGGFRPDGTEPEPNPFCSNRSEAGDACGECAGCLAEMDRIRGALQRPRSEVLIHLNITVPTDDQAQARTLAESYLAAHEIPSADVALIDPQ